MEFNEKLKFSWGHIIAFLALIFIFYASLSGMVFINGGNLENPVSWIVTIVIVVVLFIWFFCAQQCKGSDHHFDKRIKYERFFVYSSPLVFLLCMLPYYHFCAVHQQDEEICKIFNSSLDSSRTMFQDYDRYAEQRINQYRGGELAGSLVSASGNKNINLTANRKTSDSRGIKRLQKDCMVRTLELKLKPDAYCKLEQKATRWLDSTASKGASTYNIFLMGNMELIRETVAQWQNTLWELSEGNLSNEDTSVSAFSPKTDNTLAQMDELPAKYKWDFPNFPGILSVLLSVFLYFCLLFPFFLQERNSKNLNRLRGEKERAEDEGVLYMNFDETSPASSGTNSDAAKPPYKGEKEETEELDFFNETHAVSSRAAKSDAVGNQEKGGQSGKKNPDENDFIEF